MYTNDEAANRQHLEQAYGRMEAKMKDKAQREKAERVEEKRRTEEYEKARSLLLAEGLDEKEALGAKILEKIRFLNQDKLIKKARRRMDLYSDEFAVIHRRPITNTAERMPKMLHVYSEVDYFQLDGRGHLTYNQLYSPHHFSDGYLYHEWIENPQKYGVKLASPADFQQLSINSVRGFHEALESGEHLKTFAGDMKRLSMGIEDE